jgi:glycosyltransferase involved in cell wall biosynthesis
MLVKLKDEGGRMKDEGAVARRGAPRVSASFHPSSFILRPSTPRPLRVLHVINSFESGGAEAMLCNLVLRVDRKRFEPSVVALINDLSVAGPLLEAGIPVTTMGMRPGVPDPRGVARLVRHLRRLKPDVIHSWMDHSNLITALAARVASAGPLIWGIHHSDHVAGVAKRSTLMTVSACAALSHRLPARIVSCSEHGRTLYERRGFAAQKLAVIPNGFDTDRFRPDPEARASVRRDIGAPLQAPLVGLVARFDPLKDHATFLRAAAHVSQSRPDVHFLMCGTKVDRHNAGLLSQVDALGLSGRCHLLGPRRDVARIHAALDVAASSSISEAFPLAIGEAMACGVPCVATDVGDSALMIGATGRVVPSRDPAALAAAVLALLALRPDERAKLGGDARRRVREKFDLGAVARRYERLYEEVAVGASGRRRVRHPERGEGSLVRPLIDGRPFGVPQDDKVAVTGEEPAEDPAALGALPGNRYV